MKQTLETSSQHLLAHDSEVEHSRGEDTTYHDLHIGEYSEINLNFDRKNSKNTFRCRCRCSSLSSQLAMLYLPQDLTLHVYLLERMYLGYGEGVCDTLLWDSLPWFIFSDFRTMLFLRLI